MKIWAFSKWIAVAWACGAGAWAAEPPPADNANIVRVSRGEYTYRTLQQQRVRAREEWTLTVHPDGSRTMMSFVDNFDAAVQFNLVQRVDAEFRPLESFVIHWVGGQRRGSAYFSVDRGRLRASVESAGTRTEEVIDVPAAFSLQPHPVATDGWRGYWYDKARRGVQSGKNFNVGVAPDAREPLRGKLEDETAEWLGAETITVPAGTFETDHYRFRGTADMWITGPDRLVVRYATVQADREYVLTRLQARP
jgi:hypothetical protein